MADFDFGWGGGREQNERGGGDKTPLCRMKVYLEGTLLNVLGLGDDAGGGEGGVGGGGG